MSNKVVIIGGGTVSPVRKNLTLIAYDLGYEAKKLAWFCLQRSKRLNVQLVITDVGLGFKHANSLSTPDDIFTFIQTLTKDPSVKMVFFAPTLVNFDGAVLDVDGQPSVEKAAPLKGARHNLSLSTGKYGTDKFGSEHMVSELRKQREDIFLVSFHRTFGLSKDEQQTESLDFLKSTNSSLVVSIDQKTNLYMVIAPDGTASYSSDLNPVKASNPAAPTELELANDMEFTMIGAVEMAYRHMNEHMVEGVEFTTVGVDFQFGGNLLPPPVAEVKPAVPGSTGLIGVGSGWPEPTPPPPPPPALPGPAIPAPAFPTPPVPVT